MSEFYTKDEVDALLVKATQNAVEQALRSLPFVVQSLIASTSNLKSASERFYNDNPDLTNHKPLVAKAMEKVERENPGFTIEQVVDRTAIEARKLVKGLNSVDTKTWNDKPEQSTMNAGFSEILKEMER